MQKFLVRLLTFCVLLAASLWITSLALEPTPFDGGVKPDTAPGGGALVQVYGADVVGLRGHFAIHTWVATRARGADEFRIYEVIGWRLRRGRPAVRISEGDPDRNWFGSPAVLLQEVRGAAAEPLIGRIEAAVASYPFPNEYRMWPGPNSNSFTEWIALEVPELGLDLPAKAIGQSWMRSEYPDIRPGGGT